MTSSARKGELASGLALDLKSICKLLTTCKSCGVSRLKLGDLEVRFHDSARQPESQKDEFPEFADSSARDSAPIGEDKAPPRVPKDLVERFAEEQLLLDDPLAFENAQLDATYSQVMGKDEKA